MKFVTYKEPEIKDMAIILVIFNISDSQRIKNNLFFVKNKLDEAKIPYFIGELAYFDKPFIFEESENVFQYRSDSVIFYKENLINLVEEQLSDKYTKICILDGDVMFDNENWYTIISETLKKYTICQPFKDITYLDQNNNEIITYPSFIRNSGGRTGFVWAFKREWLHKYKLFEYDLLGGGDFVFAFALRYVFSKLSSKFFKTFPERKHYMNNKLFEYVRKLKINQSDLTYCEMSIYHLFHGSLENRRYEKKDEIFKNIKNLNDILYRREGGILEFKLEKKDFFNNLILKHFVNRKDDEFL